MKGMGRLPDVGPSPLHLLVGLCEWIKVNPSRYCEEVFSSLYLGKFPIENISFDYSFVANIQPDWWLVAFTKCF